MSYKKFNDLQYLYEGVVSESNEIDEYSELVYNIILAEMVYKGHSESVIKTYVENINEEQILEKVESFFSLEEYNLNEEQTDLLFSFYQEQQLIVEGKKQVIQGAAEILKKLKGSSSKLKNMVMSILGKGKGSAKQLELNMKGAKDGPGLLKKLQNLKTSAGNQLNKVKSTFDKKVTKTSDTLLGPDGKPLKTTTTVNPINKKNAAITGGLATVGGIAAVTGNNNKKKVEANKKEDDKNTAIKNQVDKYVADRKGPINKDLTIDNSEAGKAKYAEKAAKREAGKQPINPSGKELPKPRAVKPGSARANMIARNKEIFGKDSAGNDRVDMLRNKNAAFQASKKSGSNYSRKDFIKDFPDSNAAKDARKSKRIPSVMDMESYDAYDLVLDYIMETKQASNIEEANYIMIEMDQSTVHEIVEAQKKTLGEGKKTLIGLGLLSVPYAMQKIKDKFDPVKKMRDKYQDKKATEYEKKSGTTKEDGYFR